MEVSNKTTKKSREIKEEIKKELEESTINGERHTNIEIRDKARSVEKPEDAVTVVREFAWIIRSKSKKHYLAGKPTRYNI